MNAIAMDTPALPSYDIDVIKQELGEEPFTERLNIDLDGYSKCPFHDGDSDKSFHIVEKENGVVVGTCFSECGKTWDAINFVEKFDDISKSAAIRKLGALAYGENVTGSNTANITANPDGTHGVGNRLKAKNRLKTPTKAPAVPLTLAQWEANGRPVTDADAATLAASRSHSMTPSAATLNAMGFKIGTDAADKTCLIAPYRMGSTFYSVKKRQLENKAFTIWNNVSMQALFNIDAVQPNEDVYVVEGELDAGVLHEMGYVAVSVTSAQQKSLEIEMIQKLKTAKRIFLVGDSDSAGIMCMDKIAAILPPDKTHRLTLTDGKDVGEMALHLANNTMLGTFKENFDALAETATASWVTQNIPYVSDIPKEEMTWAIDRFLPNSGFLIISGKYGEQKSLMALAIAHGLESGSTVFGRKVNQPTKVLYIDRENDKQTVGSRRAGFDIPNNVIRYWGEWDAENGTPNIDDSRLDKWAIQEKGVIIFDSLVDWLDGADENNASEMAPMMGRFRRLARLGSGVIVLHHNAKGGGFRGSTSIPSGCDLALKVNKTEDGVLQIRGEKFRACAHWEMDVQFHFGDPYTIQIHKDELKETRRKQEVKDATDTVCGILQTYHDEHAGEGMSQNKLLDELNGCGVNRVDGRAMLKANRLGKWETREGARGSTPYHLKGWKPKDALPVQETTQGAFTQGTL